MKIGELFVQLGVKADTFTVRDFGKAIADIPFAAAGAITALTGLSVGFLELTKHTLDISNNLGTFRAETGLSVQDLQKWQAVAKQVGVSTDAVQSSVVGLSNAMAQLRLGNHQALLAFGRLGIRPTSQNPFDVLRQIGQSRILKSDPNVARQLMGQLGVGPEMMRLMTLSPGAFSRMASAGPTMGEKDIRAMQDFQEALGHFELVIEKSFVPVLREIEPYMADLAKMLGLVVQFSGKAAGGILETFFSKDPRMNDWVADHSFMGDFEDYKKAHPSASSTNITQNIHSTADPHEVARIAKEHLDRETDDAQKHFNNGGY